MTTSTIQVLMRKGKRGAAGFIHAQCAAGTPQHLGPLLDVLLNPSKAIDEWETIDWCRWLIAGGRTPDEFASVVRSYDNRDKCGLVWIPRVVAYRCRTCGISPCMSICRDCFHRGDHSTHDFNMFLSQAGGACDCGDKSVMKEDGFCSNHGNKCHRQSTVPTDLMCVAEAMMPRIILRLLQHFRENSWGVQANSDTYRIAMQECEGFITMLMDFNNMGDLMRKTMTKALINPQMYRNLVEPPFADTEYGRYMSESKVMYETAIDSFPAPEPPDEFKELPALAKKLQHNTLLEEFIFWTFKYEFPQNVVCFLLNMLPDQDYKEHLTRTFVLHYARIPLVLEASVDPDTLSNRVVHMSVQLFSNETLALRCVHQLRLLHVMVLSLRLMMGKILVPNTLHDPSRNFHYVIDCTKRVMKEHCYWPLVSDFNNVLSHKSVALVFLQDNTLIDMWFEFLSMLQGMNVNVRETGSHIEYETSSYYAAFSCELEAAAYPMWSIISHLNSAEHAPLAKRIISAAIAYLQDWLDAIDYTTLRICKKELMHASFHYPLHRYLAAFHCAAVRAMELEPRSLLPPDDTLALLMAHPLRVQSLFYEILSGIWVRNGLQIKGQAMTYIQANFCNSMVDMDIYFLQVCAAYLPKDLFINTCIDVFGVKEWLSLTPLSPSQAVEQDAMVEGMFTFLAILVSSRTNLGNDELTQSCLEISTLLATGDKTHSQLLELMPERSGNAHTRNFETVLKELATYRAPGRGSENLEQGLFVPKPEVWEQLYDPLHVLTRAVHRRDFQSSMDRFTAYVHEKEKSSGIGSANGGSLWPPLRRAEAPSGPWAGCDPRRVTSCGSMCGAILASLCRAAHRSPHASSADHLLALTVFLLDMAADLARDQMNTQQNAVCLYAEEENNERPLLEMFGDNLALNVRRVITIPASQLYDDTEWVMSEEERATRLTVTSNNALAVQPTIERDEPPMMLALPLKNAIMLPSCGALVAANQSNWDGGSTSGTMRAVMPSTSDSIDGTRKQQAITNDDKQLVVQESILSLLLKLHSQLSGRADSFNPEDPHTKEQNSRIGDGPSCIGVVIHKLCELDEQCVTHVNQLRAQLWPHQRERQNEQRDREIREKEERSRRAKERQQKMMEEFAQKQKQFLDAMKSMETEEGGSMDWEEEEEPVLEKEYDCVICNITAPTTHANPFGLVVLLQSTSVLAHRGSASGETAGAAAERISEELASQWPTDALLATVPAWEGAVHAQSCGHHLHVACLHDYLKSLAAPARPSNLMVERGEFLCPVCRQLANSVLPLSPGTPPTRNNPSDMPTLSTDIQNMLLQITPPPPATKLSEAMGKAMEDMTSTAGTKLKQRLGTSHGAIFAFVACLARTNIECEIVQRGGTLVTPPTPLRYKPRKDCLVPLLQVVSAHARVLASSGDIGGSMARVWFAICERSNITGIACSPPVIAPNDIPNSLPLLLRDPAHLLIQFLLLTTQHLDMAYFTCMVRMLYRLTYYQIVAQLAAGMNAAGRAYLLADEKPGEPIGIRRAAGSLLGALAGSELFTEDGAPQDATPEHHLPDLHALEQQLQELSLPFLRVAALLRYHLYGEELPGIPSAQTEFVRLVYYLELVTEGMEWSEFSAWRGVAGTECERERAARRWGAGLGGAAQRCQLAVRRLLRSANVVWTVPSLLKLPADYDTLFTYYHERVCSQCGAVPKEVSVCLLCGTLVCLKQQCCKQQDVCEAVQHATECGGSTGIFLVVTSTYIIVIRGKRACLWGSLYLDDYDEEDRDLKRGKPLYLSQDRFELLESQWLAHRFDHTKRTWVWHRDSL